MKKTLLALAVMTAAGSANAAIEIYNQDGVSVGLKGDIEVVYSNLNLRPNALRWSKESKMLTVSASM